MVAPDIDLSQPFDLDAGKLTHDFLGCGFRYAELAPEALRVEQFREALGHAAPCLSRFALSVSLGLLSRMFLNRHHSRVASRSSRWLARRVRVPVVVSTHHPRKIGGRFTLAPALGQ